ncbi:MAG TPA: pilus assembly protein TadG-related protein [Alphaproteobacteria bacterium]|jgi:hypothetical protein|nr:pilus assembly protein TadG-related protein [Alphaproteobacteria bacterium]
MKPSVKNFVRHELGRFLRDSRGATSTLIAISLLVLLGFAGAATETSVWFVGKRNLQGAADAAAFGAALASGGGNTVLQTEAKATTSRYGYVDGTNGVVVTVNKPPMSGRFNGNIHAVEVIIEQPQKRSFSALFLNTALTLRGRAVSTIQFGAPACVLALNAGANVDVLVNGTTNVNLNGCSLAVNSPGSSALDIVGNAIINAASAQIVGGVAGNGTLTTSLGVETGAPPTQDPYAGTTIPAFSGCDINNANVGSHTNQPAFDAGGGTKVICGGVGAGSQSSLTFQNGTFIVDGGSFTANSGSTITVQNATIILTSSTGTNYPNVNIAGGSTVNMSAPTTGPFAGIAMMQDPNTPLNTQNNFLGGSSQNINGVLYFPATDMKFAGGATSGGASCTQIVADQVTFAGNVQLNSNCNGSGTKKITSPPQLVE